MQIHTYTHIFFGKYKVVTFQVLLLKFFTKNYKKMINFYFSPYLITFNHGKKN